MRFQLVNMPKKMGLNTKAVEARERKAEQKKTVSEKAAKAAEDAMWADDDKNLAKKKSKKEEEERKKAELLRKKAENKALLEQEMNSIKPTAKQSIQKITQAQIRNENEKRSKVVENLYKPAEEPVRSNARMGFSRVQSISFSNRFRPKSKWSPKSRLWRI